MSVIQKKYSLQFKFFLALALVTLLASLLPAWLSRAFLYEARLDIASDQALVQAELFKGIVDDNASRKQLKRIFETADKLAMRITVIDASGTVLLDSEAPETNVSEMDNHLDRPEIESARQYGQGVSVRHSNSLGLDYVYAAVALEKGGFLRVAMPLENIKQSYRAEIYNLVLIIVDVILFCLLLSIFISRQVRKGILAMSEVVKSISLGQVHSRLHEVPGKEFLPLAEAVNLMAENIEKFVETTKDQQAQLETILDSLNEGVLVLDQGGRIRSFNKALAKLFPAIEEGRGKQLIEVLPVPEVQCRIEDTLGLFVLPGQEATDDPGCACPDQPDCGCNETVIFETLGGRFIVVHISKATHTQESLGAVAVFYDATEIMRLERVRRDFVANVSHELRTPLTAIASSAEILMELNELDEEHKQFAKVIHKHSAMLSNLVSELLALARLEDARESIELYPVEPKRVLDDGLALCRDQAESKNLQFEICYESEKNVMGNAPLLTQVFRNLLENACRYSPDSESVKVVVKEQGPDMLFVVADKGSGIPEEDLPRLFERFYRVEKGRGKSLGIGLAIAKHIVERHGGRIWVESPYEGVGTAVLFTVPLVNVN